MSSLTREETLELFLRVIDASQPGAVVAMLSKSGLDAGAFLAVIDEYGKGKQEVKEHFGVGITLGYNLALVLQEREQLGRARNLEPETCENPDCKKMGEPHIPGVECSIFGVD